METLVLQPEAKLIHSLFSFDINQVAGILDLGLTLNELYVLDYIYTYGPIGTSGAKIDLWLQTLKRKLFIKDNGEMAEKGIKVMEDLHNGIITSKLEFKTIAKQGNEDFDLWWAAYPSSDSFTHKGKTFKGSRNMKVKKDECREKFKALVLSNKFTAKELIDSINLEVAQKKDRSVELRTNQFQFMQNTLTYFNQGSYEGFVDQIRNKKSTPEVKSVGLGTFDI